RLVAVFNAHSAPVDVTLPLIAGTEGGWHKILDTAHPNASEVLVNRHAAYKIPARSTVVFRQHL
ncbi:MAG: hypothetical protein KJ667_05990, partial [Alphaproteobacteria bacterium]|nr:hypothetical protein [Alphaproteobacteria bacterium]